MKRARAILIPLLFHIGLLQAQNNTDDGGLGNRQLIDRASGKILYAYQYQDVEGSPFLYDKWTPGTVITPDNKIYRNVPLKFDEKNNEFVFNRNDSSFTLESNAIEVRLYPQNGDSLVFKKGFSLNNKVQPSQYLQVLAEGKFTFLKNLEKSIEEYSQYGDATQYKRFAESFEYYIDNGGTLTSINLNKKTLESIMGDKWGKVSQYLSQNRFSGKDEKSFIAAIRYYNSL